MKILEYEDSPSLVDQSSRQKAAPYREYDLLVESDNVDDKKDKRHARPLHLTRHRWRGSTQHAWLPMRVVRDLFLPVSYPHSVRPEYMAYQVYDSVQGLCSYLRGVVSTSAVLTAAGVGNAEATAMSAAMNWAMRDGLGMMGGLLFSYTASSLFDSYVKEFRLFADIINDVGLTLDMLAPYVGSKHVLYVTSAATICRVCCGMAAGATKGSITQHLCLRGNMADLNAKESTQETLVSLVGMLLGVALARYLHRLEQDEDGSMATTVSWTIFVVLTLVHVWANYLGVKILHLRTLNRERAKEALEGIVQQVAGESLWSTKPSSSPPSYNISSIRAPEEISESLWASACSILFPGKIRLGTRLQVTLSGLSSREMADRLEREFASENYVVGIVGRGTVCASLRVGATERTDLKAFVHSLVIRQCIKQGALVGKNDSLSRRQLVSRTHEQVNNLFGRTTSTAQGDTLSLDALRERGWEVDRLYFGFGRWRIHWSSSKVD